MPETRIVTFRKQIFDPSIEDYVVEELPTESIKKYRRVSGPSSYRTVASYTGLGMQRREEGGSFDCIGRITRLSVIASGAIEFYLIDRSGTFDDIYLPSAGRDLALGEPNAPIYNVKGTFKITIGSVASGTYAAAFELIKRIPGTFTVR
jgi:hypothetical protein